MDSSFSRLGTSSWAQRRAQLGGLARVDERALHPRDVVGDPAWRACPEGESDLFAAAEHYGA